MSVVFKYVQRSPHQVCCHSNTFFMNNWLLSTLKKQFYKSHFLAVRLPLNAALQNNFNKERNHINRDRNLDSLQRSAVCPSVRFFPSFRVCLMSVSRLFFRQI